MTVYAMTVSRELLVKLAQIAQLVDCASTNNPAEHINLIRPLLADREVEQLLDQMHRDGAFNNFEDAA